jgi:hypothetical protein
MVIFIIVTSGLQETKWSISCILARSGKAANVSERQKLHHKVLSCITVWICSKSMGITHFDFNSVTILPAFP